MEKRRERPSWDEAHMLTALGAASRSSCIYLNTGAAIVRNNRVIASGYNGAPPRVENCLTRGCRKEICNVAFDDKGKGVCRGTHAEMNALNQISRWDLEGQSASMYSLFYPCSSCAKAIVASGITRVVYSMIYMEPDSLTKEVFTDANVICFKLETDFGRLMKILQGVLEQAHKNR